MTGPTKGNAEIHADEQAFVAAHARAQEILGRLDGVVSVGFGQKQTGGEYRDDIAIVVFVREKRPDADLPAEQRVPAEFEGYPTDVRTVRRARFTACDNEAAFGTIQGGIQISTTMNSTGLFFKGTLGCIVRRRGDSGRDNIYLLTNKHVLFSFGAKEKDYVYHPLPPPAKGFQAPGPTTTLGPTQDGAITDNVPFAVPGQPTPGQFFVDAAIARIDIDCKCFGSRCTKDVIETAPDTIVDLQVAGGNKITDVRSLIGVPSAIGTKVVKVGRTTGRTAGVIRLLDAPVHVDADPNEPGSVAVDAVGTIEIDFDPSAGPATNCKGNARFSEQGDSGSVVVDEQGRVVGLLSIGPGPTSPSTEPSNICHILPVLDKLGICIPTSAGTAHGSCRATDGSGTAPGTPVAETTDDPGAFVFTGTGTGRAGGVLLPPTLERRPEPLPDADRDHLLELRDRLRQTARGRELHDVFAEVRREVGYLVRNSRPVTVAWHRGQGPAFLAHTLNHLRGRADAVPLEVAGVTRTQLLGRMSTALTAHGSTRLREVLGQHGDDLLPILAVATTVDDCLALLAGSPE